MATSSLLTTPAVELKGVGVRYQLNLEKVFSLKELLVSKATRLGRQLRGREQQKTRRTADDFWAIRDISFSVPRGVCIGLTGRNGSGKSTTLKVISGVLHPTEGELWVRGRVSALIELGAGFNPDLTGRENIYFGASVSGLSSAETAKRIDRIVDFAELRDFIDMPVRNYSSGMYARLGFALATDVDPDLLIVDEVLSVGDAPFQQKCKDRMESFKKRNKTILFVSHDPQAIQDFCDTTIELKDGRINSPNP